MAAIACLLTPAAVFADNDSATYTRLATLVRTALQYLRQKRAADALPHLEQASQFVEDNPQERWPFRVYVLPCYGFALLELGRHAQAADVLQQAMQARERIYAENLTRFIQVLSGIDLGEGKSTIKAEYARQILSIVATDGAALPTAGNMLFDRSIGSADLIFTLGRALQSIGDADGLSALYENHVRPLEAVKDDGPAFIAREYRMFKFAALLYQTGKTELAEEALARALRMNTDRFRGMAEGGAPVELVWSSFVLQRAITSALYGVGSEHPLTDSSSTLLLEQFLRSKGGSVRYFERLSQLIARSDNARVRQWHDQAQALEDRIAALPATQDALPSLLMLSAQHGVCMLNAIRMLNAAQTLDFAAINSLSVADIRSSLGGSAVIGFVAFSPLDRNTFGAAPPRYLRYCITGDQIQLQDIGEQHAVDRAARAFRLDLISGDNGIQAGKVLAQRLLRGLPHSVETAQQWIIDPDGALCLVPFEALPAADMRPGILVRSYRYVTSLEQLQSLPVRHQQRPRACVLANPLYDPQSTASSSAGRQVRLPGPANVLDLRELAVTPLPETAHEAHAVAGALVSMGIATERFEGAQATSAALRSMPSPAVLHIASHAMIFSSRRAGNAPSADDAYSVVDLVLPGRRAGLVLSSGDGPELLLAKDMARLPLQDTALVVLSACNTGNGDVVQGEGVASLRRSVELAGARSSVTALWAVPSQATTELMAAFYQGIGQGMKMADALRQAKLQKARQGRPPVEWAGFLFAGRDDILFSNGRRTT